MRPKRRRRPRRRRGREGPDQARNAAARKGRAAAEAAAEEQKKKGGDGGSLDVADLDGENCPGRGRARGIQTFSGCTIAAVLPNGNVDIHVPGCETSRNVRRDRWFYSDPSKVVDALMTPSVGCTVVIKEEVWKQGKHRYDWLANLPALCKRSEASAR